MWHCVLTPRKSSNGGRRLELRWAHSAPLLPVTTIGKSMKTCMETDCLSTVPPGCRIPLSSVKGIEEGGGVNQLVQNMSWQAPRPSKFE